MASHSLLALLLAAAAVTGVSAQSVEADQMKGIGMPILLILMLVGFGVLYRQLLVDAFAGVRGGEVNAIVTVACAIITVILSLFLFFSAAFAYALIATVLAFVNVMVVTTNRTAQWSNTLCGVHLVWFAILIGIPNQISSGIILTVSNGCLLMYSSWTKLCDNSGWIVFLLICSVILIAIEFFTMLSSLSIALGASTGSYTPISGGNAGLAAPLNQPQDYGARGEYQKVPA